MTRIVSLTTLAFALCVAAPGLNAAAPAEGKAPLCELAAAESQAAFGKLLLDAVKAAKADTKLAFDATGFRLADGDNISFFLGNYYAEYCAATTDAERRTKLAFFVRHVVTPLPRAPAKLGDALPKLRPLLRPRLWQAAFDLAMAVKKGKANPLIVKPVGDHLLLVLALDQGERIGFVSPRDIKRWKTKPARLWKRAWKNFAALGKVEQGHKDGVHFLVGPKDYGAALIAKPERIAKLRVTGRPVVMVVDDETIAVTGSADAAGMRALAGFVGNKIQQGHTTRAQMLLPLTLDRGVYKPFMPAPSAAHRTVTKQLEMAELDAAYAQTRELLEKIHDAENKDIFVSKYATVTANEVFSYCLWIDGPPTHHLPVTDRVFFVVGDPKTPKKPKIVAVATWERVRKLLGKRMKKLPGYPQRWQVTGFPTAAQLEALGKLPGSP